MTITWFSKSLEKYLFRPKGAVQVNNLHRQTYVLDAKQKNALYILKLKRYTNVSEEIIKQKKLESYFKVAFDSTLTSVPF